jgi:hypothetical protein
MSRRFQFSLRDLFLLTLGFAFYFLSLSHGGSLFSAVAMTAAFVAWFPILSRR